MSIKDRIVKTVSESIVVNPQELNDKTLLSDFEVDSLDALEIIMDLEHEFSVELGGKQLPDDLLRPSDNLGVIVEKVSDYIKTQS